MLYFHLMEEGEEKERKKIPWGRRYPQGWTHLAGCAVVTTFRCN
jgi:hypothetical protein